MSQHAKDQAVRQLGSILELADAYRNAVDDSALDAILEHPLEVTWRSGWVGYSDRPEPEEFCILLCTGGPAVRMTGTFLERGYAWSIEYQDWGTLWTELSWSDFTNYQLPAEVAQLVPEVLNLVEIYLGALLDQPTWD